MALGWRLLGGLILTVFVSGQGKLLFLSVINIKLLAR